MRAEDETEVMLLSLDLFSWIQEFLPVKRVLYLPASEIVSWPMYAVTPSTVSARQHV